MRSKHLIFFSVIVIIGFVSIQSESQAAMLADRLNGKILLQVEANGEAWYVYPGDKRRYFLNRPKDAFTIMREKGLGISNGDLVRLFGLLPSSSNVTLENNVIFESQDRSFARRLAGRIILQVEERGEAYYINPDDLNGYFLGRPRDAFRVMRTLGLGITNTDLEKILQSGQDTTLSNSPSSNRKSEGSGDVDKDLNTVEREINVLVGQGGSIGPDHYDRLSNQLSDLELKGVEADTLNTLRQKLSTLNPNPNESNRDTESTSSQGSPKTNVTANQLPACNASHRFSVSPVALSKLREMSPLGGLGPPGHTFPTEHMYLHLSAGGETTAIESLQAPADMYITEITSSSDDIDPAREEYSISFSLCQDISGYFNHVKSLSQELKNLISDVECEVWNTNPGNLCAKKIFYKVNAGTTIGGVGHLQGNFDLGVRDNNVTLAYANQSRYTGSSLNVVCPLEYFTSSVKDQLYSKIVRTRAPQCGEVMYDVSGTLQGNWFYEGGLPSGEWSRHLAFVYDSADPLQSVISIGGLVMNPATWTFTAAASGTTNRAFNQVTPDNTIYCYDQGQPGKILVQLTSNTELKIEYQNGACSSSNNFISPIIYNR